MALALIVTWPGGTRADDAATRLYLDAVIHHQAGQVDQALLDVANAPPGIFWDIARNLNDVLGKNFRDINIRNAMRRRAALLHTDIALLLPEQAAALKPSDALKIPKVRGGAAFAPKSVHDSVMYSADGQYVASDTETGHWTFASWILTTIQPDSTQDEFVRAWYRAIAATFLNAKRFGNAIYHLQRAKEVLPRDPVILFYLGVAHEAHSAPLLQNVLQETAERTQWNMVNGTMVGELSGAAYSESAQLKDAERFLRDAVKNGAPPEAQVHLARVLSRAGKHAEAVAALEQVGLQQHDDRLTYLQQLFLGAEYGAAGRFEDARARLENAARLYQNAQSPLIALSDVAISAGNRTVALDMLHRLQALPLGSADRTDPWWDYFRAYASDAPQQMAAVRSWPNERGVR